MYFNGNQLFICEYTCIWSCLLLAETFRPTSRKMNALDMDGLCRLILAALDLQDLQDLQERKFSRNTRASNFIQLESNFSSRLKTVGGKSIYHNCAKLWNDLPGSIRMEGDYTNFKSLLKTHLFKKDFLC